MTTYEMNEGSFEIDDAEIVDATVHAIDADIGGSTARIVVERADASGSALGAFVKQREENEARDLPGYALLAERETAYADALAVEFSARFRRKDESPAYLRRTHLTIGKVLLSVTMSAPFGAREACDAWMDRALGSFRFRAD